jgi:hypothetical protein
MAADLSAYGLFQRRELLLDDDALLDLENGFGSDRVRRVLFERVQTVIAWTNVLVGWLVFAIISLTIGIVFLIPFVQGQDSPVVPFGFIFAPIGLVFTLRYLFVQRYHLLIRMIDGTEHRIVAIAMPRKFHRFVRRLTESISAFQASESERRVPAQ